VGDGYGFHNLAYGSNGGCPHQQVDVISHYAVGKDIKAIFIFVSLQNRTVVIVICILQEDILAVVPTTKNVMNHTWNMNSERSPHDLNPDSSSPRFSSEANNPLSGPHQARPEDGTPTGLVRNVAVLRNFSR
jgi:hypothetical protein